jgi:hypothetical protein
MTHPRILVTTVALAIAAGAAAPAASRQDTPTPEQRLAAFKQALAENQKRLRGYEWVETTIISLKGEEKARKQQRCYYGADGKVQKVPMGDTPAPKQEASGGGGGRRGGGGGGRIKSQIVENKKEDIQEYMEAAAALIHQYVPPQPELVQKAKDAGKMAMNPTEPGKVRLAFKDYVQAGDQFTIDVNAAANSIGAVNVATYLEKPEDVVSLDVKFAALPDTTSYPAQTTFEAKAKNMRVVIQNSGHRPAAK